MGSNRSSFGFYETPDWVADLVAHSLNLGHRSNVVDLGAGRGALLRGILRKKSRSSISAIEIDSSHLNELNAIANKVYRMDIVESAIPFDAHKKGYRTTVISNPPFGKINLNDKTRKLLVDEGLIDASKMAATARYEAVFLARALERFGKGSEAAFIVSAHILHGAFWRMLRRSLIERHALSKIILLPTSAYPNTEVETAIIFLSPHGGMTRSISLEEHGRSGRVGVRKISPGLFVDAGYVSSPSAYKDRLGDIVELMYRGWSCSAELSSRKVSHLHSSHVNSLHSKRIDLPSRRPRGLKCLDKVVGKGDILVSRVGTRCLGKAVLVQEGRAVISDSLISIRVPETKREEVFEKIISSEGQLWLKEHATGSCAKIITYKTIQNFPIG